MYVLGLSRETELAVYMYIYTCTHIYILTYICEKIYCKGLAYVVMKVDKSQDL